MEIHPQSQNVLKILAAGGTPMNEMTGPEGRAHYDKVLLENNPITIDIAASDDFDIPGPHGPIRVRSYIPNGLDLGQWDTWLKADLPLELDPDLFHVGVVGPGELPTATQRRPGFRQARRLVRRGRERVRRVDRRTAPDRRE